MADRRGSVVMADSLNQVVVPPFEGVAEGIAPSASALSASYQSCDGQRRQPASELGCSWFPVSVVWIVDEYHPLISTKARSHLVFDLLVDHAGVDAVSI